MAAAIAARDVQIMELQHRTRELLAADTPSDLGRDKAELLDQINQQLTALAASRKVLEGLISKSRERTLVKVTNVRMSEGGRVVAGLVNTDWGVYLVFLCRIEIQRYHTLLRKFLTNLGRVCLSSSFENGFEILHTD